MLKYQPFEGQDCGLGSLAKDMLDELYKVDPATFDPTKLQDPFPGTNQTEKLQPNECKCLPGTVWDPYYRQCVCKGENNSYDFGLMILNHIDDLEDGKNRIGKTPYCKRIHYPSFKTKNSMHNHSKAYYQKRPGQLIFPVVTTQFGNIAELYEDAPKYGRPVTVTCEKGSELYQYMDRGVVRKNKQFCVKCPTVDENGNCITRTSFE